MSEWMSWEGSVSSGDDDDDAAQYDRHRSKREVDRQRDVWYKTRNKLLSVFEEPERAKYPAEIEKQYKEVLSIFDSGKVAKKKQPAVGTYQYNEDLDRIMMWNGSVWVECVPPRHQGKGPSFAGYETWVDPKTYTRYVKIAPGEVVPICEELIVGQGTILMGNDSEEWKPETKLEPKPPALTSSIPSSVCKTYDFSSPPLDFSKK